MIWCNIWLILHITRLCCSVKVYYLGAIQVLHNAVRVGVSNLPEKSITKVYGSMLLALRGGEWVSIFHKISVT